MSSKVGSLSVPIVSFTHQLTLWSLPWIYFSFTKISSFLQFECSCMGTLSLCLHFESKYNCMMCSRQYVCFRLSYCVKMTCRRNGVVLLQCSSSYQLSWWQVEELEKSHSWRAERRRKIGNGWSERPFDKWTTPLYLYLLLSCLAVCIFCMYVHSFIGFYIGHHYL